MDLPAWGGGSSIGGTYWDLGSLRLSTRLFAQRPTSVRLVSARMYDVPLLLVDGHNLLWRAWYGFPARIRSRDKTRDVTGVFGFFALLRVAIRELPEPPEVVVVFDGENAWDERAAIEPSYKAHRPTDADAMAPIKSLADVNRGLDALGLTQVCVDTAEADDIIAGIKGIGPITAARLLADGLTIEDLATSDRLSANLPAILRWKHLLQMRADQPLPADLLTCSPSPALPPAPAVLERLELW